MTSILEDGKASEILTKLYLGLKSHNIRFSDTELRVLLHFHHYTNPNMLDFTEFLSVNRKIPVSYLCNLDRLFVFFLTEG